MPKIPEIRVERKQLEELLFRDSPLIIEELAQITFFRVITEAIMPTIGFLSQNSAPIKEIYDYHRSGTHLASGRGFFRLTVARVSRRNSSAGSAGT